MRDRADGDESSVVCSPRSASNVSACAATGRPPGPLTSTLPVSNEPASSLAVRLARSLTDTVTCNTVAVDVARDVAANVSALYLGYDVTFYKTTMVTFINKVD